MYGFLCQNNIYSKESHFIHCVKPNNQKLQDLFDDGIVMNQLDAMSACAFSKLIRCGFSDKISYDEFLPKFDQFLFERAKKNKKNLCHEVLLAIGFRSRDFKIDGSEVFFRPHNSNLLQQLKREDARFVEQTANKINKRTMRRLWTILLICWQFLFFGISLFLYAMLSI